MSLVAVLDEPISTTGFASAAARRPIGGICEANCREIETMAEGEGFEPPEPRGSTVFKTAAIDHSATPPVPCR